VCPSTLYQYRTLLATNSRCKQHRTATWNNLVRPGYCCIDCTPFTWSGFWFNLHGFLADGHLLFDAVTSFPSTPTLGLWPRRATSWSGWPKALSLTMLPQGVDGISSFNSFSGHVYHQNWNLIENVLAMKQRWSLLLWLYSVKKAEGYRKIGILA
jgi:hypothetical protein